MCRQCIKPLGSYFKELAMVKEEFRLYLTRLAYTGEVLVQVPRSMC